MDCRTPAPSWQTLNKITYGLLPPFIFHFNHGDDFYAETTLRIVKRKRAFGFGVWQGKPVFFKLFFHRKYAARHAQADVDGARLLQTNGIKTPAIYAQGIGRDGHTHAVLFAAIPQAQNLRDWWLHASASAETSHVLAQLVTEIAHQHALGILQDDQDLKNYLLAAGEIYTIDGAHIIKTPHALTREVSLDNLAILFSHFGPRLLPQMEDLLHVYTNARHWDVSHEDQREFEQRVQQHDKSRWQLFLTKIHHESRDFTQLRHWRTRGMFEREFGSPSLLSLLRNPMQMISHQQATLLLDEGHTQIVQLNFPKPLLMQFFHVPRQFKGNKPSVGVCTWRAQHQRYFLHQSILRPIAYVDERFSFGARSYVVLSYPSHLRREELLAHIKAAKLTSSKFFRGLRPSL